MKIRNILFAGAVATLASCSSDNVTETIIAADALGNPVALELQADIAGAKTRVSGTKFDRGDSIGVSALSAESSGLTSGSNVAYCAQDDNVHFKSSSPIFFKDKGNVNVAAYYPYTSSADNTGTIAIATSAQTDYLFAKSEGVSYSNPELSMTFSHVMAKLSFTVTAGTGVDDMKALKKLTIAGVTTEGTMNTMTGALTTTATADYDLTSFSASADNKTKTTTVLLFPMEKQSDRQLTLQLSYDGVTYTAKISVPELVANTSYAYTVTLKRTGIEVIKSAITDWTNDTTNSDTSTDAVIQTNK
jgi:hypothetical protein